MGVYVTAYKKTITEASQARHSRAGVSATITQSQRLDAQAQREFEQDCRIARFTAAAVCLACGIIDCDIFNKQTRTREQTLARHLTMYLLHTTLGFNKSRIGRVFDRDPSTVSYACIMIEDQREPGAFEARVCALEVIVKLAAEDFANVPH